MKILSPAGNFECLRAAVFNGADEVYLGINQFNARNNIDGFTMETLGDAVDFAHLYGVKVNLAINILFTNEEIADAVKTAVNAYNLGVDYFIIQDLGLAQILHRDYPFMTLHASTQMGIHNLEGVKQIEKFGFKRVVLARETPLEEIKRIKDNSPIEIEYFAHGALCVSFSGNCYLSSYLHNASGNRGVCKQLCRLPYKFCFKDNQIKKGYLLSAKDFNLSTSLKELENAGVTHLKIEGRARRAFYVASVTREYFKALNGNKVDNKTLKLAFNRGFTKGYFDGNGNIISDVQNHIGIFCAKVDRVKKGKTFNEVFFTSSLTIDPKSTFKVFKGKEEKCVVTAHDLMKKGDKYRITTTQNINEGDTLNLIVDERQESSVREQTKRVDVNIDLTVKNEQRIRAEFIIGDKKVAVDGEIAVVAKTSPLKKEEIEDNFNKSEIFNAKLNICALDNVFIQKKALNEFRRNVFSKIHSEIVSKYKRDKTIKEIKLPSNHLRLSQFEFTEYADGEFRSKNIIYSPQYYLIEEVKKFIKKCETENRNAFLDTPNFATKKDIEILENIITITGIKVVANNYYALSLPNVAVIGGGLNVYNDYTAEIYNIPIIFAENKDNIAPFAYMTLRHCPMKANLNATCNDCPYKEGYYYVMESGKRLKLKRKKLSSCTFYLV